MKRNLLIVLMLILLLSGCSDVDEEVIVENEQQSVVIVTPEDVEFVDAEKEYVEDEYVEVETRTFRVTAYCSCEKCCGKWALNRPLDEYGNPIVRGASGEVLIPLVSCASPMAFGTQVDLGEYGVVRVVDRTAQWIVDKYGEDIIDIYFDNHEEALVFGVKYLEGVILSEYVK